VTAIAAAPPAGTNETAGARRIRNVLDRWAATNENVGRTYGLFGVPHEWTQPQQATDLQPAGT